VKALKPLDAARGAVSASQTRPATAILLDEPDARLVVFRISAGQSVAPHRNPSTVMLSVLHGEGFVSGADGERSCRAGDLFTFEPNETHGMRADGSELFLMATITPRPGERASRQAHTIAEKL
jgi:quercetin dioxygenase-like cupin family protein